MASDDIKTCIIDAARQTLVREGIARTSARAIAKAGDFNQALIFYHFGTVQDLLLKVLDRTSEECMARYEERLVDADTLPKLVTIASDLYRADRRHGHITVLVQLLAGANTPEMATAIKQRFEPWMDLVRRSVRRVSQDLPPSQTVSADDIAFAIASLFLGIELATRADENHERDEQFFDALRTVTAVGQTLLTQQQPTLPS